MVKVVEYFETEIETATGREREDRERGRQRMEFMSKTRKARKSRRGNYNFKNTPPYN